ELPEHRERRAVAGAAAKIRANPGDREPAFRREAEIRERLFHDLRGLELLEAELGLAADLLPEADDVVRAPVDRRVHLLLELVFGHGRRSFMKRLGRKSFTSSEGCPCVIHSVMMRAVIGASRMPLR